MNVIKIRGVIDEYVAEDVVSKIEQLTGDIHLYINSEGGLVSQGKRIVVALDNYDKGDITTEIEAYAYSIATPIFAMGKNRIVNKYSEFGIHNPFIPPYTLADKYEAEDLEKLANMLRGDEEFLVKVYATIFKESTAEQIKDYIDKETIFNSEQMLQLGIATHINNKVNQSNFYAMNVKEELSKMWDALKQIKSVQNLMLSSKEGVNIEVDGDTIQEGSIVTSETPDGTYTVETENGVFTVTIESKVVTAMVLVEEEPAEDVEALKAENAELKAKIEEIQTENSDLKTEFENIQSEFEKIKNITSPTIVINKQFPKKEEKTESNYLELRKQEILNRNKK